MKRREIKSLLMWASAAGVMDWIRGTNGVVTLLVVCCWILVRKVCHVVNRMTRDEPPNDKLTQDARR